MEHGEGEWQTKLFRAKIHIYLSEADFVADSLENYRRQTKKTSSPSQVIALDFASST